MTPNGARKWIIMTSLGLLGFTLLFFILSPYLGYPLEFKQAMRLMQIIFPIFLGYLGSAVTFVFGQTDSEEIYISNHRAELLRYLTIGPSFVFIFALIASLTAFGLSNSGVATPGGGISVDDLASLITILLGIMSATVGAIVVYLFNIKVSTNA